MSQTTSIIYGYGFKIANLDKNLINFNDFKKLLLKNKEYLNSNELDILNCINQYNSYDECNNDAGLECAIDNIQTKNIEDNSHLETLITNVLCQKYQLPIGYFEGTECTENKNGYILSIKYDIDTVRENILIFKINFTNFHFSII